MRTKIVIAAAMLAAGCAAPPPPGRAGVPAPWRAEANRSLASGVATCVVSKSRFSPYVSMGEMPDGGGWRRFTVAEEHGLYPGRYVYVSVDGQRFSGEEGVPVTAEFLAALKAGEVMHVEWSPWPWGGTRSARMLLDGFAVAYEACEEALRRLRD